MLSDMQAHEIACSGDENAVAALMELLEARKKIAAAERIIEYADGHPDMCCGQCSREIHEAEARTTAAYQERARMVGAFAALFPGGIKPSEDGDDDYYLVYLDTPEGQVSWHINKADREFVPSMDIYQGEWDGHTTDEKYGRLLLACASLSPEGCAQC